MEMRSQEDFETALRFYEEIHLFWLGASDLQVEGNWVWDSNQEEVNLNYFWASGRPAQRSGQNCLVFSNAGTFDYQCDRSLKAVCKYN